MNKRISKPTKQKSGIFEYLSTLNSNTSNGFRFKEDKDRKAFTKHQRDENKHKNFNEKADSKPKRPSFCSDNKENFPLGLRQAANINIKPVEMKFFDEYNKKPVKMPSFQERDLTFLHHEVFRPIAKQTADNDVDTDDEVLKDSLNYMIRNLKETISKINKDKGFLEENLTNKLKYK